VLSLKRRACFTFKIQKLGGSACDLRELRSSGEQ
jgi:hypothetical protein